LKDGRGRGGEGGGRREKKGGGSRVANWKSVQTCRRGLSSGRECARSMRLMMWSRQELTCGGWLRRRRRRRRRREVDAGVQVPCLLLAPGPQCHHSTVLLRTRTCTARHSRCKGARVCVYGGGGVARAIRLTPPRRRGELCPRINRRNLAVGKLVGLVLNVVRGCGRCDVSGRVRGA
jgi:hypothetical protein